MALRQQLDGALALEPIEDVPVGARRIRVEQAGEGVYCWSVYLDTDVPAEQHRGVSPTREEAWRVALVRVEALEG